jgi:hypothetical protein
MIIWRGAGVLVIFIVFLTSLCANVLTNSMFGKGYWETESWPFGSAMLVAGALIFVIDLALATKPARVLIDERTMERVEFNAPRDFFFIPMRWWAPITATFGIYLLLSGSMPGR